MLEVDSVRWKCHRLARQFKPSSEAYTCMLVRISLHAHNTHLLFDTFVVVRFDAWIVYPKFIGFIN